MGLTIAMTGLTTGCGGKLPEWRAWLTNYQTFIDKRLSLRTNQSETATVELEKMQADFDRYQEEAKRIAIELKDKKEELTEFVGNLRVINNRYKNALFEDAKHLSRTNSAFKDIPTNSP